MASFNLKLDKRIPLKDDKYNLSVLMINGRDVMYLKIIPITEKQYESVFIKKSLDTKSVEFRNNCFQFLHKCESTFAEMNPFDKVLFRELVYNKVQKEEVQETSLLLTDLCTQFLKNNDQIKLKTRQVYQSAVNSLEKFQPGITIPDITPSLLLKYEKSKREKDSSPATISAYLRHLRGLINYFMYKEKLIPADYTYPFGRGGYTIKKYRAPKFVMSNAEIKSVVDFTDFQNPEQEYARNIWLLLYRSNGINYADLLRMKWTHRKNNFFVFPRMKTENTRRTNVKDIIVPIKPNVQELIDKVGVKDSPYILGLVKEGYSEKDFNNKKDWERSKINASLKYISEKLNLSVDLRLKTSRDCFATTHKRAGTTKDVIGEMMGHSDDYISTPHYLADLDTDKIWDANDCLF